MSSAASPDAAEAGDAPAVLAAEPQLYVRDLGAALAFYTDALGFELAFAYGEPPFYAQVRRGGARLNLRLVHGAVLDPAAAAREDDLLAATLIVDGVDRLFAEVKAAGATIHQPLRTEPWGARTFIVADPEGSLLLFGASA